MHHKFESFDIDIVQPRRGTVTYELGVGFFALFQDGLLEEGTLTITSDFIIDTSKVKVLFAIVGTVVLTCDRSLEKFDHPINLTKEVNFEFGDESKELDTDFYMLAQKDKVINLAQHIYDFISLEIPIKRLHPRFLSEG
jgi:uncharacterized metal-binding protein YceD (DUF177 family)